MLNKNSIISVPVIFVFLLLICLFYTCSEDPVTSQLEGLDSARFNVRIKTLDNIEVRNGYAADTSNVYLIDPSSFYHYNGSEFIHYFYSDNFMATSIGGSDNDNVYIGGEDFYAPNNQYKPRLKKWTGSGFVEIPFQDSTNTSQGLHSIFVKSNNEVWFVSTYKRIWKYDGQNMTHYDFNDFDTNRVSSYFLIDEYNNICCVRFHDSTNSLYTEGKIFMKFYKFINDNWKFYSYHVFIYNQSTDDLNLPTNIGNKMITYKHDGLYEFNGISYNKIININIFRPRKLGTRYQKTNIYNNLILGTMDNGYATSLFHWNGIRWSLEKQLIPLFIFDLEYVDSTFIGIGHASYNTNLYFFTKKN